MLFAGSPYFNASLTSKYSYSSFDKNFSSKSLLKNSIDVM